MIDVCNAIKKRAPQSGPAAIILLTTQDVSGVPEALIAGCDAVLLKPFARTCFTRELGA